MLCVGMPQGNVANADDVRRMFDDSEAQLGKVDVLVNNAGVLAGWFNG